MGTIAEESLLDCDKQGLLGGVAQALVNEFDIILFYCSMIEEIRSVPWGITQTGAEWLLMWSIKGGLRHAGWVDWEHPEVAGNVLLAR